MNQILIIDLTKKYKEKTIIKNKSLTIDGDNYNFLIGPNGTGKTTFIKCLLGEIKYEGKIEKNNLTIAYAPENLVMPDYVTMYDFLKLLYLNKVQSNECIDSKIIYYLELFSIKDYKDMLICKLSKGTKQKIVLIQALFCAVTVAAEDIHLDGGAQLRIVPGIPVHIGKERNVLPCRAAEHAHEHGGHLRARGIAHRQQITVLVTEQDAVRTGKIHRRLIPGAGRCRLGAGLRAGFGAGFDRGCRLRRGDGRLCRRCRGLRSVRFCSGDRRGGQRQHADKHEQQGQKAFAHGFLLHCFLRISTVFIITEGCDFSTVFAEISNYLSLLCHRRKKSSAASQGCA